MGSLNRQGDVTDFYNRLQCLRSSNILSYFVLATFSETDVGYCIPLDIEVEISFLGKFPFICLC